MIRTRRRSLHLPASNAGLLARQCPRCDRQFEIEIADYEERGHMNLRCPYCRFISELDNYTTGAQRRYIHAELRNYGLRVMEEKLEEAFDGQLGSAGDGASIEIDVGDVDFGRVESETPVLSVETERLSCEDCGFGFAVLSGETAACPICR